MEYYLLDLERTLANGVPYFWKSTKHGYTTELQVAGLFTKKAAEEIMKRDIDNRTCMIHYRLVERTKLLFDMRPNEEA